MTDIDKKIAELRALWAKATQGEWENLDGVDNHHYGAVGCGQKHIAMCNYFISQNEERSVTRHEQKANTALIVATHNYLPIILDMLEVYRSESTIQLAEKELNKQNKLSDSINELIELLKDDKAERLAETRTQLAIYNACNPTD